MVSSPLLLRRQCLSLLGPSSRFASSFSPLPRRLLILWFRCSSYYFLFLFRPSTLAYSPLFPSSSSLSLFARRTNTADQLHLPSFFTGPPRWPRCHGNEDNEDLSKTANNKCFPAPRNIVKFLPALPILPRVRAVFPESHKPNVRGNWRVIRVSRCRDSLRCKKPRGRD